MDELLKDFLTETSDHIEAAGSQLVLFERNPADARLIAGLFRLIHTIKGTCGFLGLPRLSYLSHAAEAMITHLRDGGTPLPHHVNLVLAAIDRIKFIISELERTGSEPAGDDNDLIPLLSQESAAKANPPTGAGEAEDGLVNALTDGLDGLELGAPMPVTMVPVTTVEAAPRDEIRQETVRVSVHSLERMMTLVSELVLTRNQLLEIARHRDDEVINMPLQRLSGLTSDLQDSVMRARMQPVGRLFAGLPRLIRELSSELGKPLILQTYGAETEVDRQIIEMIRDPLTHLIRNSADHGIETPEARLAAKKTEAGTIRVSASHEAGQIIIEIFDDGRGLDVERISAKAVAMGLASEADIARMSSEDICRFIFAAGFSTARELTSVSGRGVGMDVVRENLEAIGGAVSLATTPGEGTRFYLKIPLTLAIAPALIVEVGGQRFALPQHSVVEAVGLQGTDEHEIEMVQGASLLRLREAVIPVADLQLLLGLDKHQKECKMSGLVVVMRLRQFTFGLRVDNVADVQEVVVKPLGATVGPIPLYSGNTILGDGAVVLILNPLEIAGRLGFENSNEFRVFAREGKFEIPATTTRMIVFRAGDGPLKALPLSVISRVENIQTDQISLSEGRLVMPFQKRLMPLVAVDDSQDPRATQHCPILVIAVGGEPMGLLITAICDIVEIHLDIEIGGGRGGILGMAQIAGEAVEVLDAAYFMNMARPHAFARGQVKRFHILLVDDKPFFLDMLGPVLSVAGYQVTTASSAAKALEYFEHGGAFELIVTDIDMPEMDGYAFAKVVRADPRWSCPPILALAAYSGPTVQQAARASGMSGAVGKFDRQGLLKAVAELLDQAMISKQTIEKDVISGMAA
ncbi:MAG: hybrid sensor histidine kinase/response regulator [Hyphomicrobiales bacterium]|nr:hybrid sensor histidine kinase/response regulator [Hyphomicrobiales bacterium]MDE2114352.1 hybrid sensor histidine kinase/response regulator [Hyphomicrobiales bacterium]